MSLINGNGAWDETFCCRSDQPALKRDLWYIAHTPAHTVHPTTLFSPTGPSLASCWFHNSCTADGPAGWSINRAPLFTQISHSCSYFIQLLSNLNQTSFEFLLSAKSLVHLAIYSALSGSKIYVWYALQIICFYLCFFFFFFFRYVFTWQMFTTPINQSPNAWCLLTNYELIKFYQKGSTSLNMNCVDNRILEDKKMLCGKAWND